MLFVGVDLGTSAVKLLLMDENGKIKNIVIFSTSRLVRAETGRLVCTEYGRTERASGRL